MAPWLNPSIPSNGPCSSETSIRPSLILSQPC
jgi:hypothetical protein